MQFLTSKLTAYLPMILLSVALLVSLIMARRVWEETHEDDEPATEHERLDEFEQAYAAGELDEAELRRVRELLNRPKAAEPPRKLRLAPEPTADADRDVHPLDGPDEPAGSS